MRTFASILALSATLGLAMPASAHEAGDWLVRVGVSNVAPKSDNGSFGQGLDIDVDDQWGLTFNVAYMFTENWAVEVLAALPFEHDIDVGNLGTVASVTHLPPVVSLQYHFLPTSSFQPYAGVGLNYTHFYDDKLKGALNVPGADIDTDTHSFGIAFQLGFDYVIDRNWFINLDVRWIDINTDVTVFVPGIGTLSESVDINPWVYGLSVGYRF